jgi:hypothetical protein
MDQTTTLQEQYKQIIDEFGLSTLPEKERDEMLLVIADTIQKQFLFAVHAAIGKDQFAALEASASMGNEFYETTLKHLAPNYEELFRGAREKVLNTVKAELAKEAVA